MTIRKVYDDYLDALKSADRRRAFSVIKTALDSGVDIRDLYLEVFQPAMYEIGRLWESNLLTVAQEHLATAITQTVMTQIFGQAPVRSPLGKTVVATCIGGELHELGIRMVADLFAIDGWEVFYLGANVPHADVVAEVARRRAHVVAISMTVGGKLEQVAELVQALRRAPAGARAGIMVGGQPFNEAPDLYRTVGADCTARNARDAVSQAAELIKRSAA